MLENTKHSYGLVSKIFHWVMGIGMIGMIIFGLWMHEQPAPGKYAYYGIHKATGMLILFLATLRIIWNIRGMKPESLSPQRWQKCLATLGHTLLYGMMILIPVTGYIMSTAGGYKVGFYGLFTFPALIEKNKDLGGLAHSLHGILGLYVLGALIIVHIGAAIYHHKILNDKTLTRMLPKLKKD